MTTNPGSNGSTKMQHALDSLRNARGAVKRPSRVLRRAMWIAWAIVPVGVVALHYGPGRTLLAQDVARDHAAEASAFEELGQWKQAAAAWGAARDSLPLEQRDNAKRYSLRQGKAMMFAGDLIEGTQQLEDMLANELAGPETGKAIDEELATTLRGEISTAAYFTAWQMRLEGASDDEWLPETDKARQHLRFIAETAEQKGETLEAGDLKLNLESVIRLEQMSDDELRAMPLPKNCPECNGVSQKKRDQRASKGKGKGKKDAREQIKNDGASEAINQGKGY